MENGNDEFVAREYTEYNDKYMNLLVISKPSRDDLVSGGVWEKNVREKPRR